MSTPLPPSVRGPSCPPAFELEALSAGEAVHPEIRSHVEGCADCGAQVQALSAEAEAFLKARPTERLLGQLDRRAHSTVPARRLGWLIPALGVLVPLVAVLIVFGGFRGDGDDDGVAYKGGKLRVVVARGPGRTAQEVLGADARVRAGDVLRFQFDAEQAGHLLILELDGKGQASVFHPFGGMKSAPIAAKEKEFLPGSVELDDAPGPEFLFAVFAPRPLDAAPLLDALRVQSGRPEPTLSCEGCSVSMLRLQKAP